MVDPNVDVNVEQRHADHRRRLALDGAARPLHPGRSCRVQDRVPRVETVDGQPMWVFDGQVFGQATAAVSSGVTGRRDADLALNHWTIDKIHVGAYDPKVRLESWTSAASDAQVIFPSTIGLGGQDLGAIEDQALCRLVIELYNDQMAEIQAESHNRLLPMPLMPAWDVDTCVAEAKRVGALGARGVNMTSDPQDLGAPTSPTVRGTVLGDLHRVRAPGALPHRRQRHRDVVLQQLSWASHPMNTQLAIGGTLLFIGNARVVTNAILSGCSTAIPT